MPNLSTNPALNEGVSVDAVTDNGGLLKMVRQTLIAAGLLVTAMPTMAGNADGGHEFAQKLRNTAALTVAENNKDIQAGREHLRSAFELPASISNETLDRMQGMGVSQRAACATMLSIGRGEDTQACQ